MNKKFNELKRNHQGPMIALMFFALTFGQNLSAQEKKLTIVDLVKLQNPEFYKQIQEIKKSNDPEASAVIVDIPNAYISNVFGTGAGYWGKTYAAYYPEGRGPILAYSNVDPNLPPSKTAIEFFEYKDNKMVKINSLLPQMDCSSLLSPSAAAYANKISKVKNWVKKLYFIYKLPQEGTTITGSCDGYNNQTRESEVLSEAGVDQNKFSAAMEKGKELSGFYNTTVHFHWDKKTGTFKKGKISPPEN